MSYLLLFERITIKIFPKIKSKNLSNGPLFELSSSQYSKKNSFGQMPSKSEKIE